MIEITCTSCKRALSIDDAFAGGVCRCQFCGTIQTVPARGAAQKSSPGSKTKTLFENKARSAGVGSGSGLEDLADIVASSGLSRADLRKAKSPPPPPPKNLTPMLALAGTVIVILLVVVLVLAFHGGSSTANPAPGTYVQTPENPIAQAPVSQPPSFCGIPIDQSVVVYVIDNGSSSADVFDSVKTALFHSIDSLGSDRQFQILFWNSDTAAYPGTGTTFAVPDNIAVAKKKLQDVTAYGSTDPVASMTAAFADDPGQIIFITAKAGDLDDSLVQKVMTLRGSGKSKIDCIAINGNADDKVLAKIAAQTGGEFLPLADFKLKSFAF